MCVLLSPGRTFTKMRPCVFLFLALSALLCSVSARQVALVRASLPNQIQTSQFLSVPPIQRQNVAKCFGLARKTRTQKLQVPVLYNSMSGQTAAVPDYLFSLDDRTIDKMEADGWEVRMKTILMPDTFYQRVPVCCPWDAACYHKQQMPKGQSASSMGPCMNGGVLVPAGRSQVCMCPAGYTGVWCQIPSPMRPAFPAGPVIPYRKVLPSTADVLRQAVKQAQLWKEKMMSGKQQPPMMWSAGRPMTKGPLLSPNDHLLTSFNKHWAQQSPTDRAMRMKMAMMMNWYLKQQGERMKNMQKGRLTPMMPAPIFNKAHGLRTNPYSASGSQPFINPQMVPLINHLQGRGGVPMPLTPYGQSLLPVRSYERGNIAMNKGLNVPQARTPWDMDPWDMQKGSGLDQATIGSPAMQTGRDKLMAMAFAQYINNIQRRLASTQASGNRAMMTPNMIPQINRRLPVREPPMTDQNSDYPANPGMMNPVNNLPPYQPSQTVRTTQGPRTVTDEAMTSVELPAMPTRRGDSDDPMNQANVPMTAQGMASFPGAGPITSQQMPMLNNQAMQQGVNPINGQMLQGMPMGAAGPMPKMPSQEELQRMTECRIVLEPRISMCLRNAGHDLTLEQFMNPEYMNMARGVCKDNESVGQCVMRQEEACGEGSTMVMTRKMIDSVLQMMGMVCGQIMKIDQERDRKGMAVPGMPPQDNSPHLTTVPHSINIQKHGGHPVDDAPATTTVSSHKLGSQGHSEAPSKSHAKFSTTKIGSAVTDRSPSKAASKTDKGHHSVEPVTSESFIPGAPLWIVILIACVVFLISCLSLILIAMVVRKRRVEKIKEIERKAAPLDPKMFTIGIPPPQYATASIKTQDEFSLPPLDLAEEVDSAPVSGSEGGEEEEEDEVKKPAVSDDDADDESDEKDEEVDKKKEKKDKK